MQQISNNVVMSTVAIDNLALYLIGTMTLAERQYLASKVVEREDLTPYTMAEIDARLDESERQVAEGRFKTTAQVFHPEQSRMAV